MKKIVLLILRLYISLEGLNMEIACFLFFKKGALLGSLPGDPYITTIPFWLYFSVHCGRNSLKQNTSYQIKLLYSGSYSFVP